MTTFAKQCDQQRPRGPVSDPSSPSAGIGSRRAVFLDRDGVLNRALVQEGRPHPPKALADFELFPEAPRACDELRAAGYLLVVVTNQPDLARGNLSWALLDAFHRQLRAAVALDDVRVCPHDDSYSCACRKPSPGMLLEAAADHGIELKRSFMVGDRWRDIEAGRRAGCTTVLIDRAWAERPADRPDIVSRNLLSVAHWIVTNATQKETV